MARTSFFRENGQNNPNFLVNMDLNNLKRNIRRILLDVVNDNIINDDYIYFTNKRLIDIGMDECFKNMKYAQTEYNCAYYYSLSTQCQYKQISDPYEANNVAKIMTNATTKLKAWETAYQCFYSLSLGYDPIWVFQCIRGDSNNIIKSI